MGLRVAGGTELLRADDGMAGYQADEGDRRKAGPSRCSLYD